MNDLLITQIGVGILLILIIFKIKELFNKFKILENRINKS